MCRRREAAGKNSSTWPWLWLRYCVYSNKLFHHGAHEITPLLHIRIYYKDKLEENPDISSSKKVPE
jgi:hypothetical protein